MTELFSAREIIASAINKERLRKGFYASVAELATDTRMKKLFNLLADEEQEHVEVFEAMRDRTPEQARPPGFDEEMHGYLQALLDDRLSQQEDPQELARTAINTNQVFLMALGFEKDSILYFSEFMAYVSKDDQTVLKELIGQEREHVRKLVALRREMSPG